MKRCASAGLMTLPSLAVFRSPAARENQLDSPTDLDAANLIPLLTDGPDIFRLAAFGGEAFLQGRAAVAAALSARPAIAEHDRISRARALRRRWPAGRAEVRHRRRLSEVELIDQRRTI